MNTNFFQIKAMMSARVNGAEFSRDRMHRYLLWRTWAGLDRLLLFIGLNPSVADEQSNDPTIRRCIGFARREGASGVMVANLFSFCATRPRQLKEARAPTSDLNDAWLKEAQGVTAQTIVCWGNHGRFRNRAKEVLPRLGRAKCFGMTQLGEPRHPLYLRNDAPLSSIEGLSG